MSAEDFIRSAIRRIPGRRVLRAIAFRTGIIRYWWQYRHFFDNRYSLTRPASSGADPHRQQLWTLIEGFGPSSLLEVGCGFGANLALFASHSPRLSLSAIDINSRAVRIAKQQVRLNGGTVGSFQRGRADRLPLPDGSQDVVLSDAVFMYLPPEQVVVALREMRRVACRVIVVHTFADDKMSESAVVDGNWVHPLSPLVRHAIPEASVARVPSALAESQTWPDSGAIFIITW